jgi:hypothetical protein
MSRTNPRNTIRNLNAKNGFLLDGTAVTATAAELNILDGVTASAAELNTVSGGVVRAAELTFTETAGAGTYTGTVSLPAGASLHDIIINGVALWDNAGAVTLIAGDATDPDGYYTGVNLKATDLLAGESISFALAGGKAGAYIANSQVSPRYSATARDITVSVTTASTGGTAGRTRATVVWSQPLATAATKA